MLWIEKILLPSLCLKIISFCAETAKFITLLFVLMKLLWSKIAHRLNSVKDTKIVLIWLNGHIMCCFQNIKTPLNNCINQIMLNVNFSLKWLTSLVFFFNQPLNVICYTTPYANWCGTPCSPAPPITFLLITTILSFITLFLLYYLFIFICDILQLILMNDDFMFCDLYEDNFWIFLWCSLTFSRVLCKFFKHGACLKGEHCEYAHDWNAPANNVLISYALAYFLFISKYLLHIFYFIVSSYSLTPLWASGL